MRKHTTPQRARRPSGGRGRYARGQPRPSRGRAEYCRTAVRGEFLEKESVSALAYPPRTQRGAGRRESPRRTRGAAVGVSERASEAEERE
jgi:hypothetical protein